MKKGVVTTFLLVIFCQNILLAKTDPNDNAKSQTWLDAQLLKAVEDLDTDAVMAALKAGANPNFIDGENIPLLGHSPLNRAVNRLFIYSPYKSLHERIEVEDNCAKVLKLLFNAGAKIQKCDNNFLYYPIINDHSHIVLLLLKNGANPNIEIGDAMTPVEWAEAYGYKNIVDLLVTYGGKPVPPQEALQFRFIHITQYGSLIEMEKQLEKGAFINEQTRLGRTALLGLLDWGQFDLTVYAKISFLLQKGANPNLEAVLMMNQVPQLPLHTVMLHSARAFENNFPEGAEVYARLVIEALIKAGADVSAHGENGATPLQIAVLYNNVKGAEMLIKAGADVSDRGRDGLTPLHTAINTNLKLAEMLIEAGADVSAPMDIRGRFGTRREKLAESTYGGMTPLHVVAKYNNVVGAKMLIKAGCKLMDKDKDGKTPLDYAESAEMIKLLKSHGAKEK